jgi:hypothetical protein
MSKDMSIICTHPEDVSIKRGFVNTNEPAIKLKKCRICKEPFVRKGAGTCSQECSKKLWAASAKAYREKNLLSEKKRKADWVKNNRDRANECKRVWTEKNRTRINAERLRRRREDSVHAKALSEYMKKWHKENRWKSRAKGTLRRLALRNAVPGWANLFYIKQIYELSELRTKLTGFRWHVDHVIPLKGKNVCGLHVENNLSVIPAFENLSKHNKFADI